MVDHLEREYKYSGDNIKLTDFQKLMQKIGYNRKLDISSWDIYFKNSTEEDSFLRLRLSETPELTTKTKTKDNNNYVRLELDIGLDPQRLNEETIEKFANVLGYKKARKIYKSCFVFWQEKTNFVYYIVYDSELKELNRFLEIEINKGSGGDESHLKLAEKQLEILGLTPQHRLKKSLYEIYIK